jgi:hypothetical protein
VRVAALALTVAAALGATAVRVDARRTATGCGSGAQAGLETLSDPQRNQVNLQPKDTTLAAIAQLSPPRSTPTTRDTPFQRQVWRVAVQITEFRLAPDGDIHLVLFEAHVYGIAEMPAATCVPKKARDRKAIINARQHFVDACGQPTTSAKPLGAVAKISGVGFWHKPPPLGSHAPYAELNPITSIQLIAGCGI